MNFGDEDEQRLWSKELLLNKIRSFKTSLRVMLFFKKHHIYSCFILSLIEYFAEIYRALSSINQPHSYNMDWFVNGVECSLLLSRISHTHVSEQGSLTRGTCIPYGIFAYPKGLIFVKAQQINYET